MTPTERCLTAAEDAALLDIRGYASVNRIRITRHAYQRMDERGATQEDVLHALANAERCFLEKDGRFRVPSRDQDGDPLSLIVAILDGVVVITLFG